MDAHCHIGLAAADLDEAEQQALTDRDAGTLLVRDCGAPLDTRPLQEKLELPRIVRAGKHIARPKRYIRDISDEVEDPAQLPAAVAEQAAEGDGWVKLVGDWIDRDKGDLAPLWPDDVLAEAIKVAHEAGARVTAHVFGEEALPGLIKAGIDCIEHGTGLTADTIDLMAAHGTALVPTLINIETFPELAAGAGRFPVYAGHMLDLHGRVRADRRRRAGGRRPGLRRHRRGRRHRARPDRRRDRRPARGGHDHVGRDSAPRRGPPGAGSAAAVSRKARPRTSSPTTRTRGTDLNALRHPTRIVLRGRVIR